MGQNVGWVLKSVSQYKCFHTHRNMANVCKITHNIIQFMFNTMRRVLLLRQNSSHM